MRGLAKNGMGRGCIHISTYPQTSRLLDQIGPVGRFGENSYFAFSLILEDVVETPPTSTELELG